jgi:hypothetical protein
MQFGRYPVTEITKRSLLPNEWTEELTKVLTETYFDRSEKDQCFFDIHGEIYEKEFVAIISYIHHTDHMSSPISLFLSHDVVEDSKAFKKVLKNLVDLVGEIFDDIFANEDWSDYSLNWTENTYKGSDFFYKITRENISLTLQAEQFLNNDGNV